ncbi:hypothetical protein [Streptomyces sp. NPDC046859]|uniref:hypothetical protein n=1 Tax=Streptomyces sp. NPDC046859 TaxID=3155734 RepID=UPI0034099958
MLFYRPKDLGLQKLLTARALDTDALRRIMTTLLGQDATRSRSRTTQLCGLSRRKTSDLMNLLESRERWPSRAGAARSGLRPAVGRRGHGRGGTVFERRLRVDRSTARPLDRSTARPLDRSTARASSIEHRASSIEHRASR